MLRSSRRRAVGTSRERQGERSLLETITMLVDQRTHFEHGGAVDMQDYPADWRRALEMLAAAPEGVTDAALLAHGFKSTIVIGLVKGGSRPPSPSASGLAGAGSR